MNDQTLRVYRRRLPHWRLFGSVYFVTWRLQQAQAALTGEERSLIVSAIKHLEVQRYRLYAFVVMDDHVHVLFQPYKQSVQEILHAWKSFTANRLQRQSGRRGRIWQTEFFDRIVRDEDELLQKISYVLNNPYTRWNDIDEYQWVGLGSDECCQP